MITRALLIFLLFAMQACSFFGSAALAQGLARQDQRAEAAGVPVLQGAQ